LENPEEFGKRNDEGKLSLLHLEISLLKLNTLIKPTPSYPTATTTLKNLNQPTSPTFLTPQLKPPARLMNALVERLGGETLITINFKKHPPPHFRRPKPQNPKVPKSRIITTTPQQKHISLEVLNK